MSGKQLTFPFDENRDPTYRDRLKMKSWGLLKDALAREGPACEVCGATRRLQLDHRHYKNVPNERPKDLQWLCIDCHRQKTVGEMMRKAYVESWVNPREYKIAATVLAKTLDPSREIAVGLSGDIRLLTNSVGRAGPPPKNSASGSAETKGTKWYQEDDVYCSDTRVGDQLFITKPISPIAAVVWRSVSDANDDESWIRVWDTWDFETDQPRQKLVFPSVHREMDGGNRKGAKAYMLHAEAANGATRLVANVFVTRAIA